MCYKAIRHEELNKPDKPCEPSSEYNFSNCIERHIATGVGCQPYWSRFKIDGVPVCNNMQKTLEYSNSYWVRHKEDEDKEK